MSVTIGKVDTFPNVQPTKQQAIKILEEASEVHGAWADWDECGAGYKYCPDCVLHDRPCAQIQYVIDESADVIQAVCNLLDALGVDDMREAMKACEARNRERGRL
jgi:hypothetical protein